MLPLQGAQVWSLVGELRSRKSHGIAKKKKKKKVEIQVDFLACTSSLSSGLNCKDEELPPPGGFLGK